MYPQQTTQKSKWEGWIAHQLCHLLPELQVQNNSKWMFIWCATIWGDFVKQRVDQFLESSDVYLVLLPFSCWWAWMSRCAAGQKERYSAHGEFVFQKTGFCIIWPKCSIFYKIIFVIKIISTTQTQRISKVTAEIFQPGLGDAAITCRKTIRVEMYV